MQKYFVFRNMTIESMMGPLSTMTGAQIAFSGYENISDIEEATLYIWWYLPPYKPDNKQVASEIRNYIQWLEFTLSRIPDTKTVIAFTMTHTFEINSLSGSHPINNAIEDYNHHLYRFSDQYSNLRIFNFADFTRQYRHQELIDWKYFFISQMPLNPRLAQPFSLWFVEQLRAVRMSRKKCLVLDLDNTLWGGIVGEDGTYGIQIGGSYPGNAFEFFQRSLLELQHQGVILTVCSKNNLSDVMQVWKNNSNNLITENHLASYRINWENKAINIKQIAQELNIGLDSMVFIDDNPSERELVHSLLPQVEVPLFPEHPYDLPQFITEIIRRYFQIYSLTNEDYAKTEQYKANAERQKAKAAFNNIEDYLRSLQIKLEIAPAEPATIQRIAQMTQKTNQFNLTTKRYTEEQIRTMLNAGYEIWTLSVQDKFGDNGVTGLAIIAIDGNNATIDTFLLSCRILGKGIESEFLTALLSYLQQKGIQKVHAQYIPTLKNSQVADFYDKLNFSLKTNKSDTKDKLYEMILNQYLFQSNNIYTVKWKNE